jgi:tetraacyldisaccharide 4'-kinase
MRKIPSALAPVLYLPGLVYEAMVRARNGLYAASLLPQERLNGPVLSIGNITMGGTGKTPLVLYIAQMLLRLGYPPAVLTRGYGRVAPDKVRIVAPGDVVPSPARILGDEPALIRRHVPEAFLGIAPNRLLAGELIARRLPHPVFILDDGFQHRRLRRDLDIVVVDGSRSLRADRMFPRGILREPLSGLRRCNIILINNARDAAISGRAVEEIRQYHPTAAIFCCAQTIRALVPFSAWAAENETQAAVPSSAFLVAALGNPERFEQDVRGLGVQVRGAKFFRDHAWLTPKDWADCIEQARRKEADAIILTEKDAIKLRESPGFPLLVAVQSTDIADAGGFELALKRCIEEWV